MVVWGSGGKSGLFYFGNSTENGLAVGVRHIFPRISENHVLKSAFRIKDFFTRAVDDGKEIFNHNQDLRPVANVLFFIGKRMIYPDLHPVKNDTP